MELHPTELVGRLLTLEWAMWALPLSILLSLFVRRILPVLAAAVFALVVHQIGPIAIPALLGGEPLSTIVADVTAMVPKLDPTLIGLELAAYIFLIFVFSLTRRDMFRSYVAD
jgi:hypothetical protein